MFSIYAVGSDERDGVGPAHLPTKTVFGDLRPGLECEYVVDVIPRCAGVEEAVVGAGSHRLVLLVRIYIS